MLSSVLFVFFGCTYRIRGFSKALSYTVVSLWITGNLQLQENFCLFSFMVSVDFDQIFFHSSLLDSSASSLGLEDMAEKHILI